MVQKVYKSQPPKTYGTVEAAAHLEIGSDSLRRLVKLGQIGHSRLPSGRLKFSEQDLADYQTRGQHIEPGNRG